MNNSKPAINFPSSYRRTFRSAIRLAIISTFLAYIVARAGAADDVNAAERASLERIQTLRKQRPSDGLLIYCEAMVRLNLHERDAALALLRSLIGRKLGLIPTRDSGFDAVWEDVEFQKVRKELTDDEPSTSPAPVAFRLKDPKLIPEGIAFDAERERFFLGSIAQRKIIVTDGKGNARDFSAPSDKLDPVLGLTVDAAGGRLYAVTTNGFEDKAKSERRNAVVAYDLKTGRLRHRFGAPDAMQLNDLAVAPDGTLYVTDSMGSSLFRKKPDEKALRRFGASLPGVNGIALAPNGVLYVAVSTGILRIDTTTGEPNRLAQPDTVATGGIDGLYWHDGALFGVQNVTNPGRVVRITLAEDGEQIAGLMVLQSHPHPDFDVPTTGTISHGALHVIGNSYVTHYRPDGTLNAAGLKGTAIVAVPLLRP
jgi:sugar lactone lactonase YvrE